MPENADTTRPGWLNFRLKILLALMSMILLMTAVLLYVLERETSFQIEAAIHEAMGKSRKNFQELENTWKDELAVLCKRYTSSPRLRGAFDAAVEEADPAVLGEAAVYETKLAAISGYLILFADLEGRVICAVWDGQLKAQARDGSPPVLSLPGGDESFGYALLDGQLYASHIAPLNLFERKLGYVSVGFPLQQKMVQDLGGRVDGQLCFVVGSRVIVATPGLVGSALLAQMVGANGKDSSVLNLSGESWALFSQRLNPQKPAEGLMVYAISLGKVLAPFRRIRGILIVAALASVAAAFIIGFFLSKGLSAPILELVRGTEKVARGHLDFQIRIESRDELGVLGDAFNTMVQGLGMKEKYRDVLNKAVSPEIAEEMLKGELFLGGENRIVTTLFADIREFSAMTDGMDPRGVIAMLNDYLEGASGAIEAEGGVVDKYIGDQVMAIFGAPVYHSDDARRAVRAGLRIQETIRRLNKSRRASGKPEISIGIGIGTGLSVAGNMGIGSRLNYTVLGGPVNLAARLCSIARAGEILISTATREALDTEFETQPLEPVSLKGLSSLVPVWRVKGLRSS